MQGDFETEGFIPSSSERAFPTFLTVAVIRRTGCFRASGKGPAVTAAGILLDPNSGRDRRLFRLVRRTGAFESAVTRAVELQRLGHAGTVGRVALGEQCDLPALDLIRHTLHRRGDVVEQALLLLSVEQAEQVAGLRIVVVPVAVVVAVGIPVQGQRRLGESPVLFRPIERVWLVVSVWVIRVVVEEPHPTVLVVVMHRAARRVDW